MMDRPSVVKWRYVTNKTYSDKDSISGYIEYISKQVEDRRNATGTFITNINDDYLGKELKIDESSSINEIDNYISYIDSRIGSHCLFSDSKADIDDLVQKIKEHDGTLWLPIVSLKESYAKDFHLETERDWVDKGRELAEVYRKELNIDSDNYGWVAA